MQPFHIPLLQWSFFSHSLHQHINVLWERSSIYWYHHQPPQTHRLQYKQTPVSCSCTLARTHAYAVFCRKTCQFCLGERNKARQRERQRNKYGEKQGRLCFQPYGRLWRSSPYCSQWVVHLQISSTALRLNYWTILYATSGSVWVWEEAHRPMHLRGQRNLTATSSSRHRYNSANAHTNKLDLKLAAEQ